MIQIHMLQAGNGDCFLVQIEPDTDKEYNILIDCGYNYQRGIKKCLDKIIITKGKKIDRFIITHYDADHIQGAITLIQDNGDAKTPNLFQIEQVWLNTFRHLQFSKRDKVKFSGSHEFVVKLDALDKKVNEYDFTGDKSANQASTLGKELYKNGYCWNKDFNNKAASPESKDTIKLTDNITIQLLTPSYSRLEELEKDFIDYLKKEGLKPTEDEIFDDAFELYCKTKGKTETSLTGDKSNTSKIISEASIRYFSKGDNYTPDTTKENGSSISFILHYKGQKVLFAGDAFAEDLEKALIKVYPNTKQYPILFDAIKMPHHGSFNNCNPSLLKIIDSDKYLFSTNSIKYNHPNVETIACIVNRATYDSIPTRILYFNYQLEHVKGFQNKELEKEFNYEYREAISIKL